MGDSEGFGKVAKATHHDRAPKIDSDGFDEEVEFTFVGREFDGRNEVDQVGIDDFVTVETLVGSEFDRAKSEDVESNGVGGENGDFVKPRGRVFRVVEALIDGEHVDVEEIGVEVQPYLVLF